MITYTSTPDFYNDYLMHYGVLGMKWGVRKNPDKAWNKANYVLGKKTLKANKVQARINKKALKFNKKKKRKEISIQRKVDRSINDYYNTKDDQKKKEALSKMKKYQKKWNFVHTKKFNKVNKAQKRADKWRNKMNKFFSKTEYVNETPIKILNESKKKRRST